jgi:hypothetical protein
LSHEGGASFGYRRETSVQMCEVSHRYPRGNVTAGVTAHAICHDKKELAGVTGILV